MVAGNAAGNGRLLVFRVGAGRYALPLADVLGIQTAAQVGAPGATVEFHGRTLAVVDARSLRWQRDVAERRAEPAVLVVVSGAGEERALAVDRVEGLVESVEIREWPALVAPYVRGSFLGVALQPEGELLVVDPVALCQAGGGAHGASGGA